MKFRNIIFFAFGFGVLAYILARMDIHITEVTNTIKSPEYIVLAAIVLTLIPIINALRMRFIIFPIEKMNLPMHDLYVIEYIYKFLSGVVPFKLNVPAKAVLLNRICGMRLSSGASVVSFEYALDSAIVILFGFLGAFAYFRNDTRISFASIGYFIIIIFLFSVAFFSIPSDYFKKLLNFADHIHIKLFRAIASYSIKLLWAIRSTWATLIFHREMIKALITTGIIWASAILVNELLFLSSGVYVPPTWLIVGISSGIFMGGISTIPGGLGVREAATLLVYNYLGVPNDVSVSVVLLGRILGTLPILTGYLYSVKIGYDKIMIILHPT